MHLPLVSCATKLISSCTKPELINSVILRQATFPIVLLLSGCTLLSTWRTTLVSFIAASLTVLCTCPPHVCINLFDHCVLTAFFKTGFQSAKLTDIFLILPWSRRCLCNCNLQTCFEKNVFEQNH